jgi:hypothetical protein
MKSKINGHADGGRFGNLRKILRTWVKLNEQFFIQSRDGSWWYNERASISVLAAATWMTGGVALEEFSAKKKQNKVEHSGRADVYLNLSGREFACEAKFIWLSVRSKNPITKIKNALDSACKDAKCLNRNEGRRFGVCFVPVYLSKRNAPEFDILVASLQKKIALANFDAIAWSFPAKARRLTFERSKHFHPGSFVIFQNCD